MITLSEIEERIPKSERAAFIAKSKGIATRIGLTYFALMAAMDFETAHTMRPDIVNDLGYVGLIQFGDDAAKDLGTTTAALSKMTRLQQLDYVESYIKLWMKRLSLIKLRDFLDLYLIIFFPSAVKVRDYSEYFASSEVEKVNPSLTDSSGRISKNSIQTNFSSIYGMDLFTPNAFMAVGMISFFLAYL